MTDSMPQYLMAPNGGRKVGKLRYDDALKSYIVEEAEPHVLDAAKRIFPGCNTAGGRWVRFPATRRHVGELNWFLLRYPLEILTPERFMEDRERALQHALRRDGNLDLPAVEVPPTFRGKLYPYQDEAVRFMVANERVIIADDMGLGKTVMAIAAAAAVGAKRTLVIVPPNVQFQWPEMLGRFLDPPRTQRTLAGAPSRLDDAARGQELAHVCRGRTPTTIPRKPFTVIHYGLLASWKDVLLDVPWDAVVMDEVQEFRHTGTQKYSAGIALAQNVRYAWGLSGTPIYGYGAEIWNVLNMVEYHCLGDFDSFTVEWCTGYGNKIIEDPVRLGSYLRNEGLILRRRETDVEKYLPPRRRVVHTIGHDASQYATLIQEAYTLANKYTAADFVEKGRIAREAQERARKATGVAKAPYVADFVRALLKAGEHVLLSAHHLDVHEHLRDALAEFRPVRVTGHESPRQKEEAKNAFRRGDTPLLQLALRSAAGLDGLQDRGTCVVFAELDWSPAIHGQVEKRIHRPGVREDLEHVLCYYLVADTGMDEVIQEALGLKTGQFVALMGDAPETEDARTEADRAAARHMSRVVDRLRAEQEVARAA